METFLTETAARIAAWERAQASLSARSNGKPTDPRPTDYHQVVIILPGGDIVIRPFVELWIGPGETVAAIVSPYAPRPATQPEASA